MATESISDRREHIRSIGVTALAALSGVGAALLSAAVTADPATVEEAIEIASDSQTYMIVLGAILTLILLIKHSGIYTEDELGPKHYLFILFMVFAFWFVTWGIILTTSVPGL